MSKGPRWGRPPRGLPADRSRSRPGPDRAALARALVLAALLIAPLAWLLYWLCRVGGRFLP